MEKINGGFEKKSMETYTVTSTGAVQKVIILHKAVSVLQACSAL